MSAVPWTPSAMSVPPSAAVLPANAAILVCADRLRLSRERLRQALIDTAGRGETAPAPDAPGFAASWLGRLKDIPGAALVVEAFQAWWRSHPLRIATLVGNDALRAVLQPLARRHPIALALGAALLGGVFVWSRPWRWLLKPALLAGLLPQLLAKAASQVPLQSWMALLTALSQQPPSATTNLPPEAPDALRRSGAPHASASASASKNA